MSAAPSVWMDKNGFVRVVKQWIDSIWWLVTAKRDTRSGVG
jgi:hypothetical protein